MEATLCMRAVARKRQFVLRAQFHHPRNQLHQNNHPLSFIFTRELMLPRIRVRVVR